VTTLDNRLNPEVIAEFNCTNSRVEPGSSSVYGFKCELHTGLNGVHMKRVIDVLNNIIASPYGVMNMATCCFGGRR